MSIPKFILKPAVFAICAAIGTVFLQDTLRTLRDLGLSTEFLLFIRYVGAVTIATVVVLLKKPKPGQEKLGRIERFRPKSLVEMTLRGAFMLGTTVGIFTSIAYLTNLQVSVTGLMQWPVIALLLGMLAIFGGDRIRKPGMVIASIGLSFLGMAVLVLQDWSDTRRFVIGSVIMLGTSTCTALNQQMATRAHKRGEDPDVALFFQNIVGVPVICVLWFIGIGPFERIRFDLDTVTSGHLPWQLVVVLLIVLMLLGYYPQKWLLMAASKSAADTAPYAVVQLPVSGLLDLNRSGVPPLEEIGGLLLMSLGACFAVLARRKPKPGTK